MGSILDGASSGGPLLRVSNRDRTVDWFRELLGIEPRIVASEAGPDPKVLGTTEALLSYCGKLNPSLAEMSQEQIQQITRGASDEAIAEVRKGEEYQHAREAVDEALEKVDEKDALKACAQRAEPSS